MFSLNERLINHLFWHIILITFCRFLLALFTFWKNKKYLYRPFLLWYALNISLAFWKKLLHNSNSTFHPKCGPISITHFAFVYNLILFIRGEPISVKVLMDAFHDFGTKSCLHSNILKFNLYIMGTFSSELEHV